MFRIFPFKKYYPLKVLTVPRSFSNTSGHNVFSNVREMAEIYQKFRPSCLYVNAVKKIIPYLDGKTPEDALDVGCGTGGSSFALDHIVSKKIVGIDPSVDMLRLAEKHNKNREKFIFFPIQVENLDQHELFRSQKFDLVTMANAFRLVNAQKCLQQIANVLRDSGWLSIYYYTMSGIDGALKKEFEEWFKNTFLKTYPIVSRGKPFLPDPRELHDFTSFTKETYNEFIPMNQENLTGLLMSLSGPINAVENLKESKAKIQDNISKELNHFFQYRQNVDVGFNVTVLNSQRAPRLKAQYLIKP